MLFLLVSIYLGLYYIRPTEWVPGLIGSPLLMLAGVISLLVLGFGAISKKFPNILSGQIEQMMFGLTASVIMSHLSHFYVGGAVNSFNIFLPTITGFFLVVCYIDNRSRLRFFLLLLIWLTTFLAYEGCLQQITGLANGGLEPVYQNSTGPDGELLKLPRIRWYGVFNDPNDLGLALVLVIPFLLDMFLQRHFILPLLSLPLITGAIYFTNSRGTVLAGLVAISSYFIIRYRSVKGVAVGIFMASLLFLFGPSRMSSVSSGEESAHGRIEAWYEAYQMFKSNPFFGVGQGAFTDFHDLTAHNSFVLVMAELGFVGLFFFIGLFYLSYYWLWQNIFKSESIKPERSDIGLVSSAYASLTGMLAAMFFISRSYILLPFMQIALVTALTRILDKETLHSEENPLKPRHFRNILLLAIAQIIGINMVIKLLL